MKIKHPVTGEPLGYRNPFILGFGHGKQTGKDTAAGRSAEWFNSRQVQADVVAFADKPKAALAKAMGLTHSQLHGDRKEAVDDYWGLSPRVIMQRFATEAMQGTFGKDVWVKALMRDLPKAHVLVVSDVRFLHEAAALKEKGAYLVCIERGLPATDTHVSEVEGYKIEWDEYIINNGSLDQLGENIKDLCTRLARRMGFERGQL